MSIPKNIDYLSLLPPELIEDIFLQVQQSNGPFLGPLSESLLPFQQKPLFRTLCLRSFEDLGVLCGFVKDRAELAECIKIIHVHVEPEEAERKKRFNREAKDPHSPSNKQVKQLFEKLVEVRSLVITGTDRIARLVLDPTVAATSFPNLRILSLSSTFNSLRDPFHPASYHTLQHYNELHTFKVNVIRSSKSIQLTSKDQVPSFPLHTQIDEITLSGPLSSSPTSVKHLIGCLTPLFGLSLRDTSTESRLYDLLDHVCDAELIQCLSLERQAPDGAPSVGNLMDKLEKFPNLSELDLGGTVPTLSPSFYASLRSLPHLECLTFSEEAKVSLEELKKVVMGQEKLESLKTITFNNVEGEIGTLIWEDGSYWDEDTEELAPHPDWILPEWSKEFSEKKLIEFMNEARKIGIVIEGTAVEAIGVLDKWEDELDDLDEAEYENECCGGWEEYGEGYECG
ncbi:uncharacterized protein JCM6883_007517 [Sporobolomyces salmoneus]|uniref:uncharacterized protein n=1 Tax=Sporobolomyces salmoneus TaxID=183962 RepID=UPI0031745119